MFSLTNLTIILIILGTCYGLRTEASPQAPFYSPQTYATELNNVQLKFQSQLAQLNNQLTQIDAIIKDSSKTTGVKLTQLTQKLADQRNSLYDMQQYLKIPYQLKICECRQLTFQQSQQLKAKLSEVNSQIAILEAQVAGCTGTQCSKYDQIKQQIKQMKIYTQTSNQILNSNCCKQRYVFKEQSAQGLIDFSSRLVKDNLKAPNWYYGSANQQAYRLQMFELSTKYNVTTCPLSHPFANINQNRCQRCHPRQAIFNLGTRSCFYCGGLSYLNLTTSLCQACPAQQYYNYSKQACQNCPNEMFLNITSQKCEKCPIGYHFDVANSQCVSCPSGYEYNKESKLCIQCNITAGQYYNPITYKCQGCPDRYRFNAVTNKCQICPNNTYYDKNKGSCVACEGKYIFNPNTLQCDPCPSGTYYNSAAGQCVACASGQHFDSVLQKCVPNQSTGQGSGTVTNQCPSGYFYDAQIKRCVENNNIGLCPHQNPFYDTKIHRCVPCPSGTKINTTTYKCDPV